ncbi:MAG TPA: hypothetical protein PK458_02370 [Phycisphaerae bacterium]|nr:hypothetical protein [Phycisphaerae bacterium]
MTPKSLDIKLAKIKANPSCREFILADAKDADMAFGIASPGKSPEHYAAEGKFRSLPEFHECIRQIVRQGLVDIMLMSAHANDLLTIKERLFDNSHVTPAARANDTTDVHVIREGTYVTQPSRPFRTATIDQIQCGRVECSPEEKHLGANLGLYSVTFNNDLELDMKTLEAYRQFRIEAEKKGFRHFLEVFDPNAPLNPMPPEKLGGYINDMIVRSLAGVPEAGRPLFLKMVYHGPKWTEELASYDPQLIIGILGGSSGTTYDAFKLISEAQKYGAKVALFGRKINNAEHQLAFVEMLRRIVDGQISPEEAVRAYHGVLQGLGIKPYRSLEDDMQLTTGVTSYGGSSQTRIPVAPPASAAPAPAPAASRDGNGTAVATKSAPASPAKPAGGDGKSLAPPDFSKMTSEERVAYHRARLARL